MVTIFFIKYIQKFFTVPARFMKRKMQDPSFISLLPYDAITMPYRLHENQQDGLLAKPCIGVKRKGCSSEQP